MPDLALISTAFQTINGLKTIAEGLMAAKDLAAVSGKVIELNGKIIEAQSLIFEIQQNGTALVQRVGELEKEITDLKSWDTEKQNYELKQVGRDNVFAYVSKAVEGAREAPHMICANCYEDGKKSLLQGTSRLEMRVRVHYCPRCKNEFLISHYPGQKSHDQNTPA